MEPPSQCCIDRSLATLQPDRPAGGTSGRGNDHEVLIRVLTGNIRPCFSRRPDEPSTALHHHLANRDHWHHKETGVDRGPAIIAPSFTRIATTAQRKQRRFPYRPRPRPKTCEGCDRSAGCRCYALPLVGPARPWQVIESLNQLVQLYLLWPVGHVNAPPGITCQANGVPVDQVEGVLSSIR